MSMVQPLKVSFLTDLNLSNTKLHPCHPARLAVADNGFLGIIQVSLISKRSIKSTSSTVYLSPITEYKTTR